MKIVAQVLLSAALLGIVACSGKEQKETITTAPLNLPTAAPVTDTASGAVAGLNPAHGQPGHRCDIPVGASLSLPVQPNLNAQPSLTPPPTQGAVAGLNPPHGQPGHSCAIPVGAPLN